MGVLLLVLTIFVLAGFVVKLRREVQRLEREKRLARRIRSGGGGTPPEEGRPPRRE